MYLFLRDYSAIFYHLNDTQTLNSFENEKERPGSRGGSPGAPGTLSDFFGGRFIVF